MTKRCDLQSAIYEYEALTEYPSDTIRLLTVQPGNSDIINCSMSHARLSENPSYRALSYVWGNDDSVNEIEINGKKFLVRPNLWAFLNRLQIHDTPTCVWIDAICVNQADVIERNSQVLLMSKVYAQAHAVYAWLGTEINSERHNWDDVKDLSREDLTGFRATLITRKGTHMAAQAALEIIQLLALSPYWERTWIVQEVLLGQSVILWYGSNGEINLRDFGRIYSFMVDFDRKWGDSYTLFRTGKRDALHDRKVLHQLLAFKYLGKTDNAHVESSMDKRESIKQLAGLISYASMTRCTDVRDKIYAFLSLAEDAGKYNIIPDYGKSPADLFFDFLTARYNAANYRVSSIEGDGFAGRLRIQLGCTHADLISGTQFRGMRNALCEIAEPYDGLKSKISWVLQKHALEFPERTSALPMVLIGPLLQPKVWGSRDPSRYHVSFFMTVLVAGNGTQYARDKNSIPIIGVLDTDDIFITYRHHRPVPLYRLGHARDASDDDHTSQEPKKSKKSIIPKGMKEYILKEPLFFDFQSHGVQSTARLRDNWSDIVQRALQEVHR